MRSLWHQRHPSNRGSPPPNPRFRHARLSAVRRVAVDPRQRVLAAAADDRLKAWDLSLLAPAPPPGACLLDAPLTGGGVTALAFGPASSGGGFNGRGDSGGLVVLVGEASGGVAAQPVAKAPAQRRPAAAGGAAECWAHSGPVAGLTACEWLPYAETCGNDGFVKVCSQLRACGAFAGPLHSCAGRRKASLGSLCVDLQAITKSAMQIRKKRRPEHIRRSLTVSCARSPAPTWAAP